MRTRVYGKHGPTVIVLHGEPAALGEAAPVARGLSSKFVAVEALQRGSDQQQTGRLPYNTSLEQSL
jgi:hypothetical protein